LKKISPETESSVLGPSRKDGPALVHIWHMHIPLIQNDSPTHSSESSLSYKFLSPLPTLESKKSIVEIEKNDNVDSDI